MMNRRTFSNVGPSGQYGLGNQTSLWWEGVEPMRQLSPLIYTLFCTTESCRTPGKGNTPFTGLSYDAPTSFRSDTHGAGHAVRAAPPDSPGPRSYTERMRMRPLAEWPRDVPGVREAGCGDQ
jgi:hypothetical protein